MGLFGKKNKEPTIRYYMTSTTSEPEIENTSNLHEGTTIESLRREVSRYKQLYETERAKTTNLDPLYRELQELRDFKASSKNSEKSYHERVASLQGNHRDEINRLQGIIADLKSRVPDEPGLPSYSDLRNMYNKLVRTYNASKSNSQPMKEVGEITVHSACNNEELNRLLNEAKDADKRYLYHSPVSVNRYVKSLLEFLRMHALYDIDFLSCTNADLRFLYARKIMRKYEIQWHPKCRDKDIRMCMDETWKELHGYGRVHL